MTMAATAATALGWLGARQLAHLAILRGLRAPRVAHAQQSADMGVPADRMQALRISGTAGRTLSAWLVLPTGAWRRCAPSPACHARCCWCKGCKTAPCLMPMRSACGRPAPFAVAASGRWS
jgi:hypothetical protein